MDVIIDGAALTKAAQQLNTAIRGLSLTLARVQPLLVALSGRKVLSSPGLDEKYGRELGGAVQDMARQIKELEQVCSQITRAYISDVDEVDTFMY